MAGSTSLMACSNQECLLIPQLRHDALVQLACLSRLSEREYLFLLAKTFPRCAQQGGRSLEIMWVRSRESACRATAEIDEALKRALTR
jgi:hypothetical protein